jgi:hypothetical protein
MGLVDNWNGPNHGQRQRIPKVFPCWLNPSHQLLEHHHPPGGIQGIRTCQSARPGRTRNYTQAGQRPIAQGKKPPIYWIFKTRFIFDLPWDPGDWHWQKAHNMGDAPFFGYSAKRGYQNARRPNLTPSIISFVQRLNLHNTTVAQIITRMWHNARPHKVGALIWLTFNNGLPVGT